MKSPINTQLAAVTLALTLAASCSQPYGSVGHDSVSEALAAKAMAVTPCVPGWLLEPSQIHRLSSQEMQRLRRILKRGELRRIHERYYRDPNMGNRNDTTSCIFYLYASNGQCLGGRVVGDKALMDDFDLPESDCKELYALLRPHLRQIFALPNDGE